jgi:hypothetical protein
MLLKAVLLVSSGLLLRQPRLKIISFKRPASTVMAWRMASRKCVCNPRFVRTESW